ncbi:hypothetical protein LCGC14_1990570, partial [marine sediment metagenome]
IALLYDTKPNIDLARDAKLLDLKFSVLCYVSIRSLLPERGQHMLVDAGNEYA